MVRSQLLFTTPHGKTGLLCRMLRTESHGHHCHPAGTGALELQLTYAGRQTCNHTGGHTGRKGQATPQAKPVTFTFQPVNLLTLQLEYL